MGVLDRLVLRGQQWARISSHVGGNEHTSDSNGRNHRISIKAARLRVWTCSPSRDLPGVFGEWNSVLHRFSPWSGKGVWRRLFEAMPDAPHFAYVPVDPAIVRGHQNAAGAKKVGLKIRRSVAPAPG